MDNSLEYDQKKENAFLRERVIESMAKDGASIDQIIDVVKKLYHFDREDFTEDEIRNRAEKWLNTVEIMDGFQAKKSIQTEVEKWVYSNTSNKACYQDVTCSLLVCYSDLGLKTPKEKASCRMAFKRLVERGKLEPMRNRSGMYRYINGKMDEIDFINVDTTPFPIKYPLDVHEYINTYKKSLVVLAGEPNAGKTAYLLNLAWKNRSEKPNYFSSEMGAAELNIRLKEFNRPLEEWKGIKFIAKAADFKDVIDPDGLNIIDYLEVAKEFYEIGGMLTDIFNNLRDGVAVVAIQKPPGRDVGVGGARTLDKARLYLSIEPGVLKIVKGKLWRQKCVNPNGMFVKWTLGGGANFKVMPDPATGDDWRKSGS